MRRKPGIVSKDASLTFNPNKKNVKVKDIETAREQIKKESSQRKDPVSGKFLPADGKPREKKEKKILSDAAAAYQMLQDLRYAYRYSVGTSGKRGRQRLVELMESDTEFKLMIKELMKIESARMAAMVKKEEMVGGANQQNFFVVLKGLEDDKRILGSTLDKTVDIKQIQHAINPDLSEVYEVEEVNQRAAPEQLQKSIEGV